MLERLAAHRRNRYAWPDPVPADVAVGVVHGEFRILS